MEHQKGTSERNMDKNKFVNFRYSFVGLNNSIRRTKKSIAPVVATALLIVVAVMAVIGFQTWFQTYSSSTFTNVETQSGSNFNTGIDTLIGSTLYFKNGGTTNITITSIKIGSQDCNISSSYGIGMNTINLGKCSVPTNTILTGIQDVVVITNTDLYTKKYLLNNLALCQNNWLPVPGNSVLGTSNFCVMKYEAKNIAGVATSQASLTPWVSINQTDAKIACSNLGTGYHLITDKEWVTIARLAENNPSNWNSSIVGTGYMYSGHNDNAPVGALVADTNDNNGYYLTGNVAPSNQRRTLNISGNMIWDFPGNVWEWTDDTITANTGGNFGKSIWGWHEWTSIASPGNYGPSNSGLNSVNGIGQIYTGGQPGSTVYGILRGSDWSDSASAGSFALGLFDVPSSSFTYDGFRCAYAQ